MQMSGEKVFQKEGTASAKVPGQRHTGEFETAPRERGWCGGVTGRVREEGKEGLVHARTSVPC